MLFFFLKLSFFSNFPNGFIKFLSNLTNIIYYLFLFFFYTTSLRWSIFLYFFYALLWHKYFYSAPLCHHFFLYLTSYTSLIDVSYTLGFFLSFSFLLLLFFDMVPSRKHFYSFSFLLLWIHCSFSYHILFPFLTIPCVEGFDLTSCLAPYDSICF